MWVEENNMNTTNINHRKAEESKQESTDDSNWRRCKPENVEISRNKKNGGRSVADLYIEREREERESFE